MSSSPAGYDSKDPFGALERAGVTLDQEGGTFSASVEFGGVRIPLGSTAGERFTFTLPDDADIAAAFGKEDMLKKLSKVFKKEPQIGDAKFDDHIYITAEDEALTKRFLDNDDLKTIILACVASGGLVVIGGKTIEVHTGNAGSASDLGEKEVARLVCHVMDFTA
jgi:hypothetical protein